MTAVAQSAPSPNYAAGCVVATAPLITISKRESTLPLGLASLAPERFDRIPSLNLLGLTWSHEAPAMVERAAHDIAEAARELPRARFVMLANTPTEQVQFSRAGVPNILANELIFVDERLFVPSPRVARSQIRYDAVYTARLNKLKRHDLARSVHSLLLLYGRPDPVDFARTKSELPAAVFANHDLNGGVYRLYDEKALRELVLQSSVGLCLSQVEGAMRGSIEYRLCGLPVVSIRSSGGRDRYLLGPHVRVVDADPDAIADAVRELKAHAFDPLAVRDYVGRLIAFDRHNFLLNISKVVGHVFGARGRFVSFAPFTRFPVAWRTPAAIFEPLDLRSV